jgi:hypothetical protein
MAECPARKGVDEWHPLVAPNITKTAKPMGSPALWAGSFTLDNIEILHYHLLKRTILIPKNNPF